MCLERVDAVLELPARYKREARVRVAVLVLSGGLFAPAFLRPRRRQVVLGTVEAAVRLQGAAGRGAVVHDELNEELVRERVLLGKVRRLAAEAVR